MRRLITILIIIFSTSVLANGERDHPRDRVEYSMGKDRIVSGTRALVSEAVGGDLIVAGGEVTVIDSIGGDLVAAGGEVLIDAEVGQDLYAAGGRVTLNATVKRNARIAGGKVELGRQAHIAGNTTLAGGIVVILGNVDGHLAAAGERIYINGRVAGNVDVTGGEIELGPQTNILGNLSYRSNEAIKQTSGAVVQGTVVREPGTIPWDKGKSAGMLIGGTLLFVWIIGLMLVGAIFVASLPKFTLQMTSTACSRPGMSMLLGFVILVAVPPGAVLLMATGIGIPLGMLVLIGYLAILMLGYVSAGIILGQTGLRRVNPPRAGKTVWRVFAASLAILAISALAAIPFLGWLFCLVVWLAGMGAFSLQLSGKTESIATS